MEDRKNNTFTQCGVAAEPQNVSGNGGQMKLYIGSKIIRATLMDEVTFMKTIKGQDVNQETRPGYLVLYPDGYKSWSPKRVFEEAYREVSTGEMRLI